MARVFFMGGVGGGGYGDVLCCRTQGREAVSTGRWRRRKKRRKRRRIAGKRKYVEKVV